MDVKVEKYLETLEKHLRVLTISERTDIISEIKSHIQEKKTRQNMDTDEILNELGDPVMLAGAYLSDNIIKSSRFSLPKLLRVIAFYGKTGLTGMFVVPFTGIMSVVLYICAFMVLIAGIIKTGGYLIGIDVPFIMFNFGVFEVPALFVFPVSIPFALLFYFLSKKLWVVLKNYIKKVSRARQQLIKEL